MDWLDAIIVALLIGAAVHGARRGAAVQVATFAGFLAGLALGVALALAIAPKVHGSTAKTLVAIALLLTPAGLAARLGRGLGERAGFRLRRGFARFVDSAFGSMLAVVGTLVVCWLFASVLVDSATNLISTQIESSAIVRAIAKAMPPVPNEFAAVQRYLSNSGFPVVLVNALPEPVGPVVLPSEAQVADVARLVDSSTVKVEAFGCGDIEQEGTAFVVGSDLLVTNAHVVAGTDRIDVLYGDNSVRATPVLFDPVLDLAVLRTAPLGLPVLHVDDNYVERGTPAVLFGYPGGGPLTARKAGIQARYVAEGRDIYDTALTTRTVYTLQAIVRPGNSGGPLVSTSGEVIGVVFSRSASNPDVGYALASPPVLQEIDAVTVDAAPVGTQSCIEGD